MKSQQFIQQIEQDTKRLVAEIKQSTKAIKIFQLHKNVAQNVVRS